MEISEFWSILGQLTGDVTRAASDTLKKVEPSEPQKISLEDTFNNIRTVRALLIAAIRENQFQLLPLTIQEDLFDSFSDLSVRINKAVEGENELKAITEGVEQLFVKVWTYGLFKLPKDFYDFKRRVDQLHNLQSEFQKARGSMNAALETAKEIDNTLARAHELEKELDSSLVSSKTTVERILEDASNASDFATNAESTYQKIKEINTEVSDFRAKAETAASGAKSIENEVREFFAEISQYRNDMASATASANKNIGDQKKTIDDFLKDSQAKFNESIQTFDDATQDEANRREIQLNELTSRLEDKEVQINDQLLKATGKSLFHSFDTRRKQIWRAKWVWVGVLFLLLFATAEYIKWLSDWILSNNISDFKIAVYLRFSIALPLASAIWFALAQYAKERRFEEEYAFRSNISVSLVPYRDEVAKLLHLEQTPENEKLVDFIIRSIDRVYTIPSELNQKPTDKVEEMVTRFADLPKDIIDKLPEILKAINPKGK